MKKTQIMAQPRRRRKREERKEGKKNIK